MDDLKVTADRCIELILTIRYDAFRLSLRTAQGLVRSLFKAMDINLPVPHYSSVCKRQANLNVKHLKKKARKAKTLLDLAFDSTGLKGYGEGEWKIKMHDKSKARCWCMLYLAMCPDTFEIMGMV